MKRSEKRELRSKRAGGNERTKKEKVKGQEKEKKRKKKIFPFSSPSNHGHKFMARYLSIYLF